MPKVPCNEPSCGILVEKGDRYCPNHKFRTKNNRSSTKMGYGYKWRKARTAFLQGSSLCVHCKERGITNAATEVDHVIPHKGNKVLFWDMSNWQGLCASCHSHKTATEDNGYWDSSEGLK